MIVFKIKFIKIKYCNESEFASAKQITCDKFEKTSIYPLFLSLLNNKKLDFNTISSLSIPNDTGNSNCDSFLKALRLSQRYESEIVLMNDFDLIDHSNNQ